MAVGTCQFTDEEAPTKVPQLLDELVNYDKIHNL